MTRRLAKSLAVLAGIGLPMPAMADISVFACEPEWAALAREIGGDRIEAVAATHAGQDPHYVRARPGLIADIRRADLVFCSGGGLEAGWLPVLMQRGAPAGVQPGRPGHLMAADHVTMLEKPAVVDRSLGHIHPEGNPHVHLDPRNMPVLARELAGRLAALDAANGAFYRGRLAEFERSWAAAEQEWRRRAEGLAGMGVIVHHRSWSYLVSAFDLRQVGTLEPRPGIPPTPSHLAGLLETARTQSVEAILRTPYDPSEASEWLATRTGIPAIVLPFTVERDAGPGALAAMFDRTIALLEQARDGR